LYGRLADVAAKAERSISEEIERRLETSFTDQDQIAELRHRVRELEEGAKADRENISRLTEILMIVRTFLATTNATEMLRSEDTSAAETHQKQKPATPPAERHQKQKPVLPRLVDMDWGEELPQVNLPNIEGRVLDLDHLDPEEPQVGKPDGDHAGDRPSTKARRGRKP
jgi:hypothetical protein